MKLKAIYETCPDCNSNEMVMGMSAGNLKVFGCLKCRNCQPSLFAREAKEKWKAYVDAKIKARQER